MGEIMTQLPRIPLKFHVLTYTALAALSAGPLSTMAFAEAAQSAHELALQARDRHAEQAKATKEGFTSQNNKYGTQGREVFKKYKSALQINSPTGSDVGRIRNRIKKIREEIESLEKQKDVKVTSLASNGTQDCDSLTASANQGIIANSVQIGAAQEEKRDISSSDDSPSTGSSMQNNKVTIGSSEGK